MFSDPEQQPGFTEDPEQRDTIPSLPAFKAEQALDTEVDLPPISEDRLGFESFQP